MCLLATKTGWRSVDSEDGMGEAEYDKYWPLQNFNGYPFLFGKLFNEYLNLVKQAKSEEDESRSLSSS